MNEKVVVYHNIYRTQVIFINYETKEENSYEMGSVVKWIYHNKNGTFLFIYLQNGEIVKFDTFSREIIKKIKTFMDWPNSCLSYDNDTKVVIAGLGLQIWDFENEKLIKDLNANKIRTVSIDISESETELYSGGID